MVCQIATPTRNTRHEPELAADPGSVIINAYVIPCKTEGPSGDYLYGQKLAAAIKIGAPW